VNKKTISAILILLGMLFVGWGDRLGLPQPISDASTQVRVSINNLFLGLFPSRSPKDPNKRTEDAVKDLDQQAPKP
jgi:hypothetical protein